MYLKEWNLMNSPKRGQDRKLIAYIKWPCSLPFFNPQRTFLFFISFFIQSDDHPSLSFIFAISGISLGTCRHHLQRRQTQGWWCHCICCWLGMWTTIITTQSRVYWTATIGSSKQDCMEQARSSYLLVRWTWEEWKAFWFWWEPTQVRQVDDIPAIYGLIVLTTYWHGNSCQGRTQTRHVG